MTKPLIRIHNATTGEIVDREMTDAEFEQYEKDLAQSALDKAAKEAAEAKKTALLEKLGITEEEAKLLFS